MKKVLIGLIHFYQRAISAHTPPSCRFVPTCSAYAIEAIQRFGAFKGTALAVWRILRCNPLCKAATTRYRRKRRSGRAAASRSKQEFSGDSPFGIDRQNAEDNKNGGMPA